LPGDFADGAVASRHGHNVAAFPKRLFPLFVFRRLIVDLVAGGANQSNYLVAGGLSVMTG
jgi:hypothetical protein